MRTTHGTTHDQDATHTCPHATATAHAPHPAPHAPRPRSRPQPRISHFSSPLVLEKPISMALPCETLRYHRLRCRVSCHHRRQMQHMPHPSIPCPCAPGALSLLITGQSSNHGSPVPLPVPVLGRLGSCTLESPPDLRSSSERSSLYAHAEGLLAVL
jgi:hypothetical protein